MRACVRAHYAHIRARVMNSTGARLAVALAPAPVNALFCVFSAHRSLSDTSQQTSRGVMMRTCDLPNITSHSPSTHMLGLGTPYLTTTITIIRHFTIRRAGARLLAPSRGQAGNLVNSKKV